MPADVLSPVLVCLQYSIMRYPLLLRRVMDNMGPSHANRATVQEALNTVWDISR